MPPGLAWADTECAGRAGPELTTGTSAAAAVNSSSAEATSRCTADWVAPASGTRWLSRWLTAALISASTHHTSWIQASQMTTDRISKMAVMSSWPVSADSFGAECGIGRPTTVIRAIGTPMVSAARASTAATPSSTSAGVRCGIFAGCRRPGIGGAISRPSVRRPTRRPGRRSRWRGR